MAAAIALAVIVLVVVGVAINLYLRTWVAEESRTEAHLHDPRTHTVAYAVPNGIDPAVIRTELSRASFSTGVERVGALECLRIECEEGDRARVRQIIEGIRLSRYDGSELERDHVVFEDER